jgi:hypothetical protein
MDKIKLPGGPDKTVTWIRFDPAGGELKVEFYDFSETAQRMFGNDIAYTLSIERKDTEKLYSLTNHDENSLLKWISKTFSSYFGIKQWLEEHEIDFRIEPESWA